MHGRLWTPEDDRILATRYPREGRSAQLASDLNRTLASMSERARLIGVTRLLPLAARFWAHVNKDGPIVRPELGPCWVWTAFCHKAGYGRIMIGGKPKGAHRVAWQLATGEDPGDLDILHHCDNPPCVRFEHLHEGDAADNAEDMITRRRQCKGSVFRPLAIPSRNGERRSRSGSNSYQHKLTEADVVRLSARYKAGESLTVLAGESKVCKVTLWKAVTGQTWKHVVLPGGESVAT